MNFDLLKVKTPCYEVDERLLRRNMEVLKGVIDKSGYKILLTHLKKYTVKRCVVRLL